MSIVSSPNVKLHVSHPQCQLTPDIANPNIHYIFPDSIVPRYWDISYKNNKQASPCNNNTCHDSE